MITAQNLVKNYGGFRAVDDVSFTVGKGEILGFLGPNGAGKSTTMKMITGFLPPTRGSASIGGHDISREPIAAKRLLGYLPESGPLYPEMTCLEFLSFAAELRGLEKASCARALERVTRICHLQSVLHQPIETLSKGFRQRVGLAQAILHDPPCLILDEPTDGLDPNQKREVRRLIASMAQEKAVILSTHILEEVEAMCTRVIIIAGGKVIADETPEQLRQRHPHARSVRLRLAGPVQDGARERLGNLPEVAEVIPQDDEAGAFLLRCGESNGAIPAIWRLARQENWEVRSLEAATVSLDEVFHDLTRNQVS